MEANEQPEKISRGRCLCGAVQWEFRGDIPDATICNCTACRRYGVLWAYDFDGERIHVTAPEGQLVHFARGKALTFNFCKTCGNIVSWRALRTDDDADDGRVRIAVNLRLAEPEDVASIPLRRFDGLHSFEDLPTDGRTVADVWF